MLAIALALSGHINDAFREHVNVRLWGVKIGHQLTDCLHSEIHELLKAWTETEDTDLVADLIMVVPDPIRTRHLAYTLGCPAQLLSPYWRIMK
jgi:hypothetical protein